MQGIEQGLSDIACVLKVENIDLQMQHRVEVRCQPDATERTGIRILEILAICAGSGNTYPTCSTPPSNSPKQTPTQTKQSSQRLHPVIVKSSYNTEHTLEHQHAGPPTGNRPQMNSRRPPVDFWVRQIVNVDAVTSHYHLIVWLLWWSIVYMRRFVALVNISYSRIKLRQERGFCLRFYEQLGFQN